MYGVLMKCHKNKYKAAAVMTTLSETVTESAREGSANNPGGHHHDKVTTELDFEESAESTKYRTESIQRMDI